MASSKRNRFFSLIFVPDQERNPRSISLSYRTGTLLAVILAVIGLHVLTGFYSYVKLFSLHKERNALKIRNEELVVQNRKIENIAELHMKNKVIVDKILKAYGVSLGLVDEAPDENTYSFEPGEIPAVNREDAGEYLSTLELTAEAENTLPYLISDEGGFFNPANVPTLLPVSGYLTARFQKGGWYYGARHLGIDIAADSGTPIRAAGSGFVIFADWTPDFGNLVILSHGNGYFSYYGHASHIQAEVGRQIKRGEIIALLGSSGISSAPHLHFEVWRNGSPVDPEDLLYLIQQPSKSDS